MELTWSSPPLKFRVSRVKLRGYGHSCTKSFLGRHPTLGVEYNVEGLPVLGLTCSPQASDSISFTGMPLELYLEQALQNGNFAFAVEVLSRLLNCMRICSLWGAPFSLRKFTNISSCKGHELASFCSLDADEVYVDVETHQLTVNAAVCIAANVQCGPVVMEESVSQAVLPSISVLRPSLQVVHLASNTLPAC